MRIKVDKVYVGEEIIWGHRLAIWEVSLQDFDLTTIHHDLRMMEWDGNQPQGALRYIMSYPLLESIHLFRNGIESLKNNILEQLYETGNDYIKNHWYAGIDFYKENTKMAVQIYKDLPGFFMEPHIDNGHIMFQLIINLTENDTGTAFHNHSTFLPVKSTDTPAYKATGEQGKGIVFVNNVNSAHSINHITKDRYVLYASIYTSRF